MQRDLVALATEGDHDAFSQLVTASIGRLYAVAGLILRDPEGAEDAVQDAPVQAWRDIRALRDPTASGHGFIGCSCAPATARPHAPLRTNDAFIS